MPVGVGNVSLCSLLGVHFFPVLVPSSSPPAIEAGPEASLSHQSTERGEMGWDVVMMGVADICRELSNQMLRRINGNAALMVHTCSCLILKCPYVILNHC